MSISMGSDTGGEYDVYWYQYNADGIRIKKSINGYADITYILNGSQIVGERINNEILLLYVYDEAGTVIGLKYRTSSYAEGVYDCYFFEKNLQGDIVAIYNEAGTKIGGYKYDAWGKPTVAVESTATTLERQIVQTYNPFRYRGYYYDTETGLYYLQSRYYNPEWGRFLNADGQMSGVGGDLQGYNLFAYCGNNPVNCIDPNGRDWYHWAIAVGIVAVCAVAVVVTAGGVAAGAAAVYLVASGVSAGTTAASVAAGAFLVSATTVGTAAYVSALDSTSLDDFAAHGNWFTVCGTAFGVFEGGVYGYSISASTITTSKKIPNPDGKKGGAAHQAEIARQVSLHQKPGYTVQTEVKINTPGGIKPYRYADFSVTNNATGQTWYGNVGRQLNNGLPCARERYAMSDIQGAGNTIVFFPYN